LAAEIRAAYPGARIEMAPSRGGRFEVTLDGAPIFEKSKLGRHAKPGEILSLIKQRTRETGAP
jgi:selT/selW/selH-like putative selenoprotein